MKKYLLPTLLLVCTMIATTRAEKPGFKVIVNQTNTLSSLSKGQVSRLFLKKVTEWDNGSKVAPVDLAENLPARAAFSEEVLGRTINAVKSYWQQQAFSGKAIPPPVVRTEQEAIAFVRADPGAIAYISADSPAEGVKVLKIAD